MSKKVLITGGCGYIGSHTAVEFLEAGYEVVSLDSHVNSFVQVESWIKNLVNKNFRNIKVDVADFGAVEKLISELKGSSFESIIHFAALKAVGESMEKPGEYYRTNINGIVNMLELAQKLNIPGFVFSSSCTVYGQPDKMPVTEETPWKEPSSFYGHTKQMGEKIGMMYAKYKQQKVIALRYFNPVGAHVSGKLGELSNNPPQALIPIIAEVVKGKRDKLKIFGNDYKTRDGTAIRDYIHVTDLAQAHLKACEYATNQMTGKHRFETFNLGNDRGMTVKEMVSSFEKIGVKVLHEYAPRRAGDIEAVYSDSSKAHKLLGWKPRLSLEDIARSTLKWADTVETLAL